MSQKELMVIPTDVLQATLTYLASRPYSETAKLIELVVKNSAKVEQPKAQEAKAVTESASDSQA